MLGPEDFKGAWHLSRHITDHTGQMSGDMVGSATFSQEGDDLLYYERGALTLHTGAVMQAERRYLWRFTDDVVEVSFVDNTAFHTFVPAGTGGGTPHLCINDLYKCRYDFSAFPQWETVWDVKGPRKDYRSVTRYSQL